MRTATGKIGRLDVEVRSEVNRMIRDNKPAASIQKFLVTNKVRGVTPQNISSWKSNGYQKWLRGQDRIDQMRARREFSIELAKSAAEQGDAGLQLASNAASALAVDTIQEVLEEYDPTMLKELLMDKPAKFMSLVDTLSGLRKGDQSFVKLKIEYDEYREKVQDAAKRLASIADSDTEASADDIRSISQELYGV